MRNVNENDLTSIALALINIPLLVLKRNDFVSLQIIKNYDRILLNNEILEFSIQPYYLRYQSRKNSVI